jgi:hypothetical protein
MANFDPHGRSWAKATRATRDPRPATRDPTSSRSASYRGVYRSEMLHQGR